MKDQDQKKDSSKPNVIRIVIPEIPIPWKRASPTRQGLWDNQKQHKTVTGLYITQQFDGYPVFSGPLKLEIHFYFQPPQYKKTKQLALLQDYITEGPNLVDLVKYIEAVMKEHGEIFKNDFQIASIVTDKIFDDISRTEFILTQLPKKKK